MHERCGLEAAERHLFDYTSGQDILLAVNFTAAANDNFLLQAFDATASWKRCGKIASVSNTLDSSGNGTAIVTKDAKHAPVNDRIKVRAPSQFLMECLSSRAGDFPSQAAQTLDTPERFLRNLQLVTALPND